MAFVAGREGTISGPDFNDEVTMFRFRDSIELHDTAVMGDTRSSDVNGIQSAEGYLEWLVATTEHDYAEGSANYKPGASVTLQLRHKVAAGYFNITGTATLRDIEVTHDIRGAARGTAMFKYNGAATITEQV